MSMSISIGCTIAAGGTEPKQLDPHGKVHIPIGIANSLDTLKTFVEAEGNFSPHACSKRMMRNSEIISERNTAAIQFCGRAGFIRRTAAWHTSSLKKSAGKSPMAGDILRLPKPIRDCWPAIDKPVTAQYSSTSNTNR